MAKKQIEGEVREFVDKAEFERFRTEQEKIQNKMLALLEKSVEPATTVSPVLKGEAPGVAIHPPFNVGTNTAGAATNMFDGEYLPPQYKNIFEKYFDPTDGFTARLTFPEVDGKNKETGGITFTIVVPQKFTNAGEAYLKMYKVDLRSRALQPSNIAAGIDEWCKAVSRNLHYQKNVKTK
jgi:hypothetical protein